MKIMIGYVSQRASVSGYQMRRGFIREDWWDDVSLEARRICSIHNCGQLINNGKNTVYFKLYQSSQVYFELAEL